MFHKFELVTNQQSLTEIGTDRRKYCSIDAINKARLGAKRPLKKESNLRVPTEVRDNKVAKN